MKLTEKLHGIFDKNFTQIHRLILKKGESLDKYLGGGTILWGRMKPFQMFAVVGRFRLEYGRGSVSIPVGALLT